MTLVKRLWLLLSDDVVSFCHEPARPAGYVRQDMSLDLFQRISDLAIHRSWQVVVLVNNRALPEGYGRICQVIGAGVVAPARHEGLPEGCNTTLVFDSPLDVGSNVVSATNVIIRISRQELRRLADMVAHLLGRCSHISIRHPEVLKYTEQDFQAYRGQLYRIADFLLARGTCWLDNGIQCLTDPFWVTCEGECNAGIESLAVGPSGLVYLCPPAMWHNAAPYGHILEDIRIPNRHLLSRQYSLPCQMCSATHCLRCVYLNKCSTMEVCVPAKNLCYITHVELEVQAWLARQAQERGFCDPQLHAPKPPSTYDPYELVKEKQERPMRDTWREMARFTGRPGDLNPLRILAVVHELGGWVGALRDCAAAGNIPSVAHLKRDALASLRRTVIERYRNTEFQEACPTVFAIELAMCALAKRGTDVLSDHSEEFRKSPDNLPHNTETNWPE